MLDENLPAFRFKSASDPLSTILYFSHNGTDPAPEYLLRRVDPALPASRAKYAAALCDAYNPDVIYAEVTVEPEWTQPTLSAAEIRAQAQSGAPPVPATPLVPDSFTIQLYNPDQGITVRLVPGGWNKTDSWEFELPVQSFIKPSASALDRETGASVDLIPRLMFRWKKDGRLSKDLTCYLSGKNLGGRKNKEPDITIALFKATKESVVTVYEPNLNRVEVEDRKGLELVLLLGAEVIKDLFITPKPDIFNVSGSASSSTAANARTRRKSSHPTTASPPLPAMSGALSNLPPNSTTPHNFSTNALPPAATAAAVADVEAETRRLQAMVEREQREQEKRERAEQKRIKRMLEEEESARLRREAEIAKETERLRKKYGVEGQDLPSFRPTPTPASSAPQLPPRNPPPPTGYAPPPPHLQQQQANGLGPWSAGPTLPPRPLSAGPSRTGPFHCSTLNSLWNGPSGGAAFAPPPPHMVQQQQQQQQPMPPRRVKEERRRRVRKKRSMHW
ncbi:hypothetical protein B0T22DRAFT_367962 [Podospora appendiculata]|uniref:Uncharacterized protein n=1 Tax=Podospora appendiculata TaxID=314037 RepID=A0AAE0XFP9_9PEZI|nr:hypothetical protein B0T22DRAFT_367962 [Podospora appendiculata]